MTSPRILLVLGLVALLSASGARAHDAPGSTTFDLLVPSDAMSGQITFATLIGPPAGAEVLHATWQLTFTSPPGGTPASEVILELGLPLPGGLTFWEISGADLGWPAANGTFSGSLGSDLLNGVLSSGLPGGTFADLHILAESGGVTGQFTSSKIVLELAGDVCQQDLGFQGPGQATIEVCGEPLAGSGTATFTLTGGPPSGWVFLGLSLAISPAPFAGGTFVALPLLDLVPVPTDAHGGVSATLGGGLGPVTVYVQGITIDASQPFGYGLTNALALEFSP